MRSALLVIFLFCLPPSAVAAFECKVCHSKNPAMVRMHTALRGQGCFGCHKVGDKLMGKGQPKDRDSLLKRRRSDELCLPCHHQAENQNHEMQQTAPIGGRVTVSNHASRRTPCSSLKTA